MIYAAKDTQGASPSRKVPKSSGFRLPLTGPAPRDFAAIDSYTARKFGDATADRYDLLIRQALRDIQDDPNRLGVKTRPETLNPEFKLYHLTSSSDRVSSQPVVKEPRHFIIYRQQSDLIEVLRVLHDSRDLARHLPPIA